MRTEEVIFDENSQNTNVNYQNTPSGIIRILQLFQDNYLSYILFKCEHIFAGQNKNLDILFATEEDYATAARLLEEQGFAVWLSEKIEKYKIMYCGFVDVAGSRTFHSIHLHREIAWHGMKALNKKMVFQRKRILTPFIIVPSLEDSLLIHTAHIVFENFKITEKEKKYFFVLNLQQQLKINNWEYGFWKVMSKGSSESSISLLLIAQIWIRKLLKESATLWYITKKSFLKAGRFFSFKRKGLLISLVGVNGSGKTTTSKKILETYSPITSHLGKRQHYYYFGWHPEFFVTKAISSLFRKKEKKIFQELNVLKTAPRFSLFQEILFLYIFLEFYYRYFKHVFPKLGKGDLVVTDRYFYDIYGQYPYAKNSLLLPHLIVLFPKPDFLYVLDAPLTELQKREKTNKHSSSLETIPRSFFPAEYLQQQRDDYSALARYFKLDLVNTNSLTFDSLSSTFSSIVHQTWIKLL